MPPATRSRPRTVYRRWLPWTIAAALALLVSVVGAGYAVSQVDMAPRQVGPYLERRASGHNTMVESLGRRLAATLADLDGGAASVPSLPDWRIGAQAAGAPAAPSGKVVPVSSPAALLQAMAQAQAGDVITLQPGTYSLSGARYIAASAAGTRERPITVRAEQPGSVSLAFHLSEGILVRGPYWTFANLTIRGACANAAECHHAFHVVGRASGFVARNNTISDFNAHFKINGEDGSTPDEGVLEGNSLRNSAVRATSEPVTPIDLVAASRWTIRGNLIADFIKQGGDNISYGAFAKGAGKGNVFERNVVLCEHKLRGYSGQRVGLSLGGGGTGRPFCRDQRCITEQDGGVIQSNLIASCSDEGIYLNRAAASQVLHNTLIDTAGVMVRYPESSATLEGNIVDGRLRVEHGGLIHGGDNLITGVHRLFLGSHPERALFRDALGLDLAWAGAVPRRAAPTATAPADLCGRPRPAQPAYGALENIAACLQP